MATFTHLFDQSDPDDKKRRGTQFEHVTKLYLETDPIYSQEFKRDGCGMSGLVGGAKTRVSTLSLCAARHVVGDSVKGACRNHTGHYAPYVPVPG